MRRNYHNNIHDKTLVKLNAIRLDLQRLLDNIGNRNDELEFHLELYLAIKGTRDAVNQARKLIREREKERRVYLIRK